MRQNARRPPISASVPARTGRRTESGAFEASALPIAMPGSEPINAEISGDQSIEPIRHWPFSRLSERQN